MPTGTFIALFIIVIRSHFYLVSNFTMALREGKFFMQWFALHVKSRHEFTTDKDLRRKEIETYLPSVKKWRQWKDRKKLVEFPLFPGYLFVHISETAESFLNVYKTRGAVSLVSSAPGSPTSVSPEEISALMLLTGSGKEIDVYPFLKTGAWVRVKRGSLKGAEGILEEKAGNLIFLVRINLLGRTVGVKIYADDIEEI